MNRKLKEKIYQDYGFKSYKQYLKKCFFYPEIKIGCQWRKAQYYTNHKSPIVRLWWKLKWLRIRKKSGYQISLNANIGPGLKLLHDGTRIIVSGVNIGRDCMIGVNVVIGYTYIDNRLAKPTIGDRVYIGHNVSIVGEINIGSNVLIAPNAFVNRDVPDNSVVIGNNIIISKNDPSSAYLDHLITPNCSKSFVV